MKYCDRDTQGRVAAGGHLNRTGSLLTARCARRADGKGGAILRRNNDRAQQDKDEPNSENNKTWHKQLLSSTASCFFGAEPGRRAHQKLIILRFGRWFPSQQRAKNSADESQR